MQRGAIDYPTGIQVPPTAKQDLLGRGSQRLWVMGLVAIFNSGAPGSRGHLQLRSSSQIFAPITLRPIGSRRSSVTWPLQAAQLHWREQVATQLLLQHQPDCPGSCTAALVQPAAGLSSRPD